MNNKVLRLILGIRRANITAKMDEMRPLYQTLTADQHQEYFFYAGMLQDVNDIEALLIEETAHQL